MKVSYRQAASDDVVRQFRYLVTLNVPEDAIASFGYYTASEMLSASSNVSKLLDEY